MFGFTFSHFILRLHDQHGVNAPLLSYPDQGYAGTLQVPWPMSGVCRCPDQCQKYASTLTNVRSMQVRWSVSGICRYLDQCQEYASTLTSVSGMQVPWAVSGVCSYPDQCQGYASTLTNVRNMQVPWPVSGICRYPDQCQEYAGTLTSVRSMQVPWTCSIRGGTEICWLSLWPSLLRDESLGRLSVYARMPHTENNSMGGYPKITIWVDIRK